MAQKVNNTTTGKLGKSGAIYGGIMGANSYLYDKYREQNLAKYEDDILRDIDDTLDKPQTNSIKK